MSEFRGPFAAEVFARFAMGDLHAVIDLPSDANRLWRIDTSSGRFVVKAFIFESLERLDMLRRAAAFESLVRSRAVIAMPQPLVSLHGNIIESVPAGDGEVLVRVHRWLNGQVVNTPAPRTIVYDAGAQLAVIQKLGRDYNTRNKTVSPGDLWTQIPCDPKTILEAWVEQQRTARRDREPLQAPLQAPLVEQAWAALEQAAPVIDAGNRVTGDWIFTHCDYKPENCLAVEGRLAVLDWDECALCHPRLEAVEAAVRWAGAQNGRADRQAFATFVRGYRDAGGNLNNLTPADFSKYIAAIVSWFGFMGQRALGQWGETHQATHAAGEMAASTLRNLIATVTALDEWATWQNDES